MSRPKLSRILLEIQRRVETILVSNGYLTDIGQSVRLDMRAPQVNDLPAALVYLGQRSVEDTRGCTATCEMELSVAGYVPRSDSDDFLELADNILSDIQRAVELVDDNTLGGLLRSQYGLQFLSSDFFMPEIGADAVGARVTYSAPNMRIAGDPEIV